MSSKKRQSPLEAFISEVEAYVKSFDPPVQSMPEEKVEQALDAIRNEIFSPDQGLGGV